MEKILVTGGAGYIGSHTVVELLNSGYEVVVVDNLSNSDKKSMKRVEKIVGPEKAKNLHFFIADILDQRSMEKIMEENPGITGLIQFAGLKAVGESNNKEHMLDYWHVNVDGLRSLLEVLQNTTCKKLVFSSSATVYGDGPLPCIETQGRGRTFSTYGWTKWVCEQMLEDWTRVNPEISTALLRYFNPIGAHESGLIGEDPSGIPNNLLPFVSQVAVGKRPELHVFGNNYDTEDGTCRRDYLSVVDLAKAHVKAIEWLYKQPGGTCEPFNLGTGNATSVLEIVEAYKKASGQPISYVIDGRRDGDLPEIYANVDKAREVLGWEAKENIEQCCASSWKWQSMNPDGYATVLDCD